MNKEWVDAIKDKIDSFNQRIGEINTTLRELKTELESKYNNIRMVFELNDMEYLEWEIRINNQIFYITEEEIAEEQIVEELDEHGNIIDSGLRKNVKQALQSIILKKLK